jgi:hypothetical protein
MMTNSEDLYLILGSNTIKHLERKSLKNHSTNIRVDDGKSLAPSLNPINDGHQLVMKILGDVRPSLSDIVFKYSKNVTVRAGTKCRFHQ